MRPTKKRNTAAKRAALRALEVARHTQPVPPPKPFGYVVYHSNRQTDDGRPLSYMPNPFGDERAALVQDDNGTIFPTWEAAFQAVDTTIAYEIEHDLSWSLMFGDMLIASVSL